MRRNDTQYFHFLRSLKSHNGTKQTTRKPQLPRHKRQQPSANREGDRVRAQDPGLLRAL
jgi:hypothetical protein